MTSNHTALPQDSSPLPAERLPDLSAMGLPMRDYLDDDIDELGAIRPHINPDHLRRRILDGRIF